MWGDRDVTRYIGGKPFSREEVWSKILRYAGHWSLLGFGYWVIADRASGRFLGEAGFADFKRRIEPDIRGSAGDRLGAGSRGARARASRRRRWGGARLGRPPFRRGADGMLDRSR